VQTLVRDKITNRLNSSPL